MSNITNEASKLFMHNMPVELVKIKTSFGSTPRSAGAIMIVSEDGKSIGTIGGGRVEYEATKNAVEFLKQKKNGEVAYNLTQEGNETIGMACGGDIVVDFTYLEASDKSLELIKKLDDNINFAGNVYIFGAGHVAVCLSKILNYIGFDIIVWDDREDFANEERFPDAKKIIAKPYEELQNNNLNITKDDYVIIMTRGHVSDYMVEKEILKTNAYYIGVIGSKNKTKTLNEKLLQDGFTKEDLQRVCAPIGLQIGAESPEEIAISVAAQIINFRAKKENRQKLKEI